jgi:hypothetical protein
MRRASVLSDDTTEIAAASSASTEWLDDSNVNLAWLIL